jgi:NADH-quinone oxidoreductase subunit J
MILYDLLFYIFATLIIIASLGVVSLRNSVYSVLFLIFAFLNAAGLFVLLGAEFLAMTLIIVYVGAVAVLFLFVVMMLNINLDEIKEIVIKRYIVLLMIGLMLLVDLGAVIYSSVITKTVTALPSVAIEEFINFTNTESIGMVLYTRFSLPFEISGLILLVAMIGAITLTYRITDNFHKKQNISKQLLRTKETGMKVISVKVGEGVDAISNK